MPLLRRPSRLSRRVLVVLVLQAVGLGLLATSALGTSKEGPAIASTPQLAVAASVAHDTTAALDNLPVVPNDPNRVLPELERQLTATASPQTADAARQTAVAGPAVPATTTSFDGLKFDDLGAGYVPPDPVGDVGLTQYVQAVNGGLAVFTKTGVPVTGAINDSSFWNGLSGCQPTTTRGLTDPTVNYDQLADRWVYAELSVDISTAVWQQSYMCVAVSTTGDATDGWNRYVFAAGNGVLPDYPKLGVWPDGYYLSFNDYSNTTGGFVGAGAMVLQRSAMLTGSTAQSVFVDLRGVSGLLGGMLPSDADGATPPPANAPNYYVTPVDDPANTNDQLGVWTFQVDWATPSNSAFTNPQAVSVLAYNGNTQRSVAQPGTSQLLDGLADERLMNRLQYRNFGGYQTLVTNLSVDNGSSGLAPRWFELRKVAGSWTANQESTFAPSGLNRWMGSVAMDGAGDMALGYSAGDAGTAPQLRYTGRLVGDSLSTMQPEATLAVGQSQTGTERWGDYSQMTVDPADDCTFWYTGEYYASSSGFQWGTRIGSFRFPSCSAPAGPTYSVAPSISGTMREGATLTAAAGTWSPAPTATTYQWRRCTTDGVSCVDISTAVSSTYTLTPADAGRRVLVKVSVTAASGSSSAVSAATGVILPLAPANLSTPIVTGPPEVNQTLSTSDGTWSSYATTPTTLSYQWKRCTITCGVIPGATTSTYTLVAADANATIVSVVTAHNIGGTTQAASDPTIPIQLPPEPVNTVAPAISGTAQAGSTLTVSQGTWSGAQPISYAYQWQQCDSAAANCLNVSGQTTTSYVVNSGDVGRRLRASVTATNPGGGTVVNTSATSVVTAAAAGGGSGGGSGGGGGTGAPDLAVTGFASNSSPLPGDTVTFAVAVTDRNGNPAEKVIVDVVLSSGLQYVRSSTDRGQGCVATSVSTLRCSLDWLSNDVKVGNLQITTTALTAGPQSLTATASAQQGDSDRSNNLLTVPLVVASTTTSPALPTSTPAPHDNKPTASALASAGTRGHVARLRFKIYDDTGIARALTTIKRGSTIAGKTSTGFGPVEYGSIYFTSWRVPAKTAKGKYTFCVVALDRSGNKSAQSCAPLTVK
ncbi:MAG: hypothetical protein ACJ76I_15145 [Gaiellaceae bacterium]